MSKLARFRLWLSRHSDLFAEGTDEEALARAIVSQSRELTLGFKKLGLHKQDGQLTVRCEVLDAHGELRVVSTFRRLPDDEKGA